MGAQELMDRAVRHCYPEDAARIRSEIEKAQIAVVAANAAPARKQAERAYKRALREIALLEREYENQKYEAEGAAVRRQYDDERNRAAWSRGADYMTEQRMRDRVRLIYGS